MTMTDCTGNTLIDDPCSASGGLPVGTDSGVAASCNAITLDNVINGNEPFYYNRVGKKVASLANLKTDPQNWLQRDFGAVPLTNAGDIATSDATNQIETALQNGGALHIEAGVYVIKRPIVASGITTIVGQSAGAGTGGFDPDDDPDTFLSALIKEAEEGAAIFYVDKDGWSNPTLETAAITFREPRFRNMPSIFIENFKIVSDINTPAPIGLIKIEGAYDNNSMLNVNAMFCGDSYHAIEVTKGAFQGTLGQSVNWTGVNAIGSTGGNRTAATIKIDWLQEGTFNSCKAFGSPYRVDGQGNPLYSANPAWEIDNSRGLVWVGCSGALTLGSGFLFKATERSCQYHLMDGCTYELVGKRVDDLLASDVSIYTEGGGLLETPQASSFTAGQLVKFGAAATQEYKVVAVGSNEIFVQPAMSITSFVDDVYEVKPSGSAIELHRTTASGLNNITVSAPRIEVPVEHFLWAHSDTGRISNIKAEAIFGKVTLDETSSVYIETYSKYNVQQFNSLGVNVEVPANANVTDKTASSLIIEDFNTPQTKYTINPNDPNEYYRTAWTANNFEDFGYIWQNTKSEKHMLHGADGSLTINDGVDFQSTVNYIKLSPENGVQSFKSVSPTFRFYAGDSSELEGRITYSASTLSGELSMDFRMDSGSSLQLKPTGSLALNNQSGTGTGIDLQAPNTQRKVITVNNLNEIEINGQPLELGGPGAVKSASNTGTGIGVYSIKSGSDLRFKTIRAIGAASIAATTEEITISSTDTDTIYGTENVGASGEGVAFGISNNQYRFRRISGGSGVSVSSGGDVISVSTIGATGSFTSADGKTVSVTNGVITSIT
ncbi:hypothetical protein PP586_gp04 [Pseudoalteromonas phage vB_PspS-H40/1]|uniref:hypothetical protein n=1 Tax=Pseudoalteromonas phage vB_PspS-H40/1 TaxID=1856120 RepID=UPI0007DCE04C|nr:hypothetical protein PP586_gp04 [Pseudoalteromonas phage vB_PspS-H40/1]ANI22021.1 hypothetical protein H401_4 [Pseudoalteromonas phage vB_PspS-H40/1]